MDKTLGSEDCGEFSAKSAKLEPSQAKQTGRYLVVFREGATDEAVKLLQSLGFEIAISLASESAVLREDDAPDKNVLVLERLGVAIVAGRPERIGQLVESAKDSNGPILSVEPEKVRRALRDTNANKAAQAGNATLRSRQPAKTNTKVVFDESDVTWGLQATKVHKSSLSGRNVRVAILDTGIDFSLDGNGDVHYHPDFESRTIVSTSFVTGAKTAKDGDGHGTHCLGTACGPLKPKTLPRYGIAYEADIFVAKVLDDSGEGLGLDGWILAGIEWAVKNGCKIVSMSLGTPKNPGDPFSMTYETVAQRALIFGTLIIAAAGNDSDRPGEIFPVDEPADSPSIMAVAAIRPDLDIASFSNGGINPNGGEVNIAAPGVDVYSSSLMPKGYAWKGGTSMAAPHVAGIAALICEASGGATGEALWNLILEKAYPSGLPSAFGAGLVQAP
jgi:subtilisin family serine protease